METRNYMKRLESYKASIVGRTVYWLTCIGVMYENNRYTAKCVCKCGNRKDVDASRFAKGNIKNHADVISTLKSLQKCRENIF